eukprot:2250789-Lingulodinium_polyedra.AAC.1
MCVAVGIDIEALFGFEVNEYSIRTSRRVVWPIGLHSDGLWFDPGCYYDRDECRYFDPISPDGLVWK